MGSAGTGSLSAADVQGKSGSVWPVPRAVRAKLAEAVAWCLDWAALADRAGELAKNLSGGMKRRLNMAAGIIHRPKVVLMDEPTVGVDPQSRNRIFEMIEALRTEGTAIIYTTHYMEEAERLCDRVAIIDHGRIIASGTNEELVRNAFASRSQVLARFDGPRSKISAWAERHGGRLVDSTAELTIEHSTEIAGLLDDAAKAGTGAGGCVVAAAEPGVGVSAALREGSYAIDFQHCSYRSDCPAPRPRFAGVEFHFARRLLHHLRRDLRRPARCDAQDQPDYCG